jgi:hypothetical protein
MLRTVRRFLRGFQGSRGSVDRRDVSHRALKAIFLLVAAAVLLGSEAWPQPPPAAPLVGFSYSPELSQWSQRDPSADLATLLSATEPDLVRLPIYWEDAEPAAGELDFTEVDGLLAVVAAHDATSSRPTRVILVVGARNFLYPELHAPPWAGPRQQPNLGVTQAGPEYRAYFDASLIRYRSSPLLYAWQVENEPFDYVVNATTGDDQISPGQLAWEIGEVHRLDGAHRAVTTSFDGFNSVIDWLQVNASGVLAAMHGYPSGHPQAALDAADALGLDIYVDGPSTPLRFTSVALRTSWKQQTLAFWAGRAALQNKEVWLTELQAQPWGPGQGFTTADLVASAAAYRQEPLRVALMWGVDTWLADPAWMTAATAAMNLMKAPG